MRKGILLNDNGEIWVQVSRDPDRLITGGLVIGESDTQNVEHIIRAYRGEYKENPTLGGEIMKQQNGIITQTYRRFLQIQLETDGYDIKDVEIITK